MKNLIKIAVLIIGTQFVNAQEFQTDRNYSIVLNERQTDKETSNYIASLVLTEYPEMALSYFEVDSANRIETIRVETLKHAELKDVDDIIRVDMTYSQPYNYTVSQYILITSDIKSVLLPPIVNNKESNPTSETKYVFPNQFLGTINRITKLQIIYKDSFKIEDVNVLQNYAWNDSDYGNSGATLDNF